MKKNTVYRYKNYSEVIANRYVLKTMTVATIIAFIVSLLLGYLTFSLIAGLTGSGCSSMEDAEKFVALGASRLGTSRIVKIVKNQAVGDGY